MSNRQSWGMNRRESLQRIGTGMGVLGLAGLLAQDGALGDDGNSALSDNPLTPKSPHFAPKAKRIIFLFMSGGPSQHDLFDYKPNNNELPGGNAKSFGRDHHPRCFSIWLAGGGVKGGITHGETDDWCYNIAKDPVHVHDLNATIQHLMGIDHERLTYRYQGRDYRLTDVHGKVVKEILS